MLQFTKIRLNLKLFLVTKQLQYRLSYIFILQFFYVGKFLTLEKFNMLNMFVLKITLIKVKN
jgi:hypothetical protein